MYGSNLVVEWRNRSVDGVNIIIEVGEGYIVRQRWSLFYCRISLRTPMDSTEETRRRLSEFQPGWASLLRM